MRLVRISSIIVLFFLAKSAWCQVISGVVKDERNKAVPYASIGMSESVIGTVSDEKGRFKLDISNTRASESLIITCLGFNEGRFSAEKLKTQHGDFEVKLSEKTIYLPEVKVKPVKLKEHFLGNRKSTANIYFESNLLGTEIGTAIKVLKPAYVNIVHLQVGENSIENLKIRINFYDFKDKKIGNNLLNKSIITTLPIGKQEFKLDVSSFNIFVEDNFFLAVEILQADNKKIKEGVIFKAGLYNGPTYTRKSSNGKWVQLYDAMFNAGVGFGVTASD